MNTLIRKVLTYSRKNTLTIQGIQNAFKILDGGRQQDITGNKHAFSFCSLNNREGVDSKRERTNKANIHSEIIIKDKLGDDIEESVYDKEFEYSNDVMIEDKDIMEDISHIIDESDPQNPYIFQTKFGKLKYIQSAIPIKQQGLIKRAYYLHNTISTNFIRKIMKSESASVLLIFSVQANYNNANQIFTSVKKMVEEFYYGTETRPKNPFKKCTSPAEIYNLSRRISIEQKNFLQRICIIVSNNGNLRLRGQNVPQSQLLLQHLGKQAEGSMEKHDFVVPYQHWQGIHSAEQYENNGIPIPQLNGKKVFPIYGVWPPTHQHYLKLLSEYLVENKHFLRGSEQAIDLGSGSGVLSFMLAEASPDIKVLALDKSEAAVRCTGMNAAILSLSASIRNEKFDFTQPLKDNSLIAEFTKQNWSTSYDIILANPPWMTTNPLSNDNGLESGNYDPKETVLKFCFQFAQQCLNREVKRNRKGRFLLIYSDLAENLGIQSKGRIQELCEQHKLVISDSRQTKLASDNLFRKNDPNYGPKSVSSVFLYEITRA